ncbi:penicillin-binding transpeptidase domain-containing protein [Nocardioides euryhalodurans]|uniref:Penicillin-binding protein n=1 Tax=Nocardioides euryhalodurans TaxID=2518370 RepID=A0A4P7GLZ0_9ACTN|nr:penicillin-binding transpeptidase domain-containing protein [Nocardioides euryhalodurans]QBR93013.1 penicillin-binding protein [Nocardioides euryhalodurans]
MSRSHRGLTAAALVLLLTGCTGAVDGVTGPDPADAAEQLATGLASGELDEVAVAESVDAGADYAAIVEGLGEVTPTVTVEEVTEGEGDTATATLGWSWPVSEQDWTYSTEAAMSLVDDTWQVTWEPAVVEPSLRTGGTLALRSVTPPRADIVGAGGQRLVTDRAVTRFGIDKSAVPDQRAVVSARELAALLDIDAPAYVERVKASGDEAFVEGIVYRREDVPLRVGSGYQRIRGALAVQDTMPLAPTREFAAPILGTVGPVTAEMVEEDPDRYQAGDEAGLSGLQARYDEQLAGTPGVSVVAIASDDKERELFGEKPVRGRPLRLTLDPGLQQTAERLLAPVGPASALVAMRPGTGEIVAAANGPGTEGYNVATYGQFAPGSTFKAVSTLALLRAGLGPDASVECSDTTVVDGKQFENYDDYPASGIGTIPLRTAVANSCNTAFIDERGQLGRGDLADAAASLGLGVDHDLGFPSYFGQVPPAQSETEAAADMIGQGKVLASPMVMSAVIASVQSGSTVLPSLVRDHEVEQADVPALEPGEAADLKAMLRGVVTSGSGAALADVPGGPVIAKTGTAEYVDDGGALRTHAWMIGAQDGLAVAVFVETGESGSSTAGPILEAFLRAE